MKILYFDCFSGISGDMTVGALLDLGIEKNNFQKELNKLNLKGYKLEIKKKAANSIMGTDFNVILEKHEHHHRNLTDIEKIINSSSLEDKTKNLSKKIFGKLAKAEAKVHGKNINEVHFHEVGAVDSIVDIVGTAICINILNPDIIISSPIHLGTGHIQSAHGLLPVPVPAATEVLKNVPVYSTGIKGELVTPTGAAIIKILAEEFKPLPNMKIEKTGYGTGKRDYKITNALRVFIGTGTEKKSIRHEEESRELLLMETNIDDMNPEIYSYLIPLLFKNNALDVYMTNTIMKKGRPGVIIHILCNTENEHNLKEIMYRETTTLGIRKQIIKRDCLTRKTIQINTEFGEVNIKAAYYKGEIIKATPEYEECREIAEKNNIPIKTVYKIINKQNLPEMNSE